MRCGEELEVTFFGDAVKSVWRKVYRKALVAPILDAVDQLVVCSASDQLQVLTAVELIRLERAFELESFAMSVGKSFLS